MHATYEDFCATPVEVILQDLEFHKYESQVRNAKSQQQNQA